MYPLFESICILNGIPQNLSWHQVRYKYSFESVFGCRSDLKLETAIKIPDGFRQGRVKARFLYDEKSFYLDFHKYAPRHIRSLKLIENDEIDYSFKYTDRSIILKLLKGKGDCDDILMVKNGKITDSSIANIVFYDSDKWFTPAYPLLRGTARERLLSEKRILLRDIPVDELKSFTHFKLINSMLDFDDQEILNISNIK